jgi:hypothetical protein
MQGSARTLYFADDRKHVRGMVVRVGHVALHSGLAGFSERPDELVRSPTELVASQVPPAHNEPSAPASEA